MQNKLAGLRVLITRPEPAGLELCGKIREQGGVPVYFPTLTILPPHDTAALERDLQTLSTQDLVFFISPQAVLMSEALIHSYYPTYPPALTWIAMGEGTANSLKKLNLPVDYFPQGPVTSETLLEEPYFKALINKRILIIKGESGRDVLCQALRDQACQVKETIAYRCALPEVDVTAILNSLKRQSIDRIVVTSSAGLENLKELLFSAWQELLSVPLLVVSARIQKQAEHLGFEHVKVSRGAGHTEIIQALQDGAEPRLGKADDII
jgi:uroporphyrinogen-III synthase